MNQQGITYLKHEEIDTDRWDKCINEAPNSLIYAQSWYLDKICDRWDALVFGNYQYVMPLTYRKKLGISYLFQPLYCQQLGIFPTPTTEISQQFLKEVSALFRFVEINMNSMQLPVESDGIYSEKVNLLLSLQDSYEAISGNYTKHTRRKLKKAYKEKLSLANSISADEYIRFKKENLKTHLPEKDLNRLRNVLIFSLTHGLGQIYGVYSPSNQLCAAAFFIRNKQRITYLNASNSTEGKNHHAMYLLIDRFIKENAGRNYFLDFEGSMIPGVLRLYEGFGATPEKYHQYRYNNLPWWIKWLKK